MEGIVVGWQNARPRRPRHVAEVAQRSHPSTGLLTGTREAAVRCDDWLGERCGSTWQGVGWPPRPLGLMGAIRT